MDKVDLHSKAIKQIVEALELLDERIKLNTRLIATIGGVDLEEEWIDMKFKQM